MQNFFDRKTFDPINNATDKATLSGLRAIGHGRLERFLANRNSGRTQISAAMRWVELNPIIEAGTFLDLGCGDSADCLVALDWGFENATGAYKDLSRPRRRPIFSYSPS